MSRTPYEGRHARSESQGMHAAGYAPVRIAPRIVPAALACTLLLIACFIAFMAISPLYVSHVLGGRSLFAGAADLDVQEGVMNHAQLVYDAAAIEDLVSSGNADDSGSEAAFAYAGAIAPHAAYEQLSSDDGQTVLRAAYVAICEGRPAVLHAHLSDGSERWVVVVGFRDVRDLGALSPDNLLVIDPANVGDGTPVSFDSHGSQLSGEGTELFVAQVAGATVSGERIVQLAYGTKVVQSGGTTQWSLLAGTQTPSTMAAIVEEGFSSCDTVILVGEDDAQGALVATGLAGTNGCPVLLTSRDGLCDQAQRQIERLGATRVIIVGNAESVGLSVEHQLAGELGVSVSRIAGDDAVETALAVFDAAEGQWGDTAIVAVVDSPAGSSAIAPYAYATHAPVFLATGVRGQLDSSSYAALETFSRVVIVGNAEAVAESVEVQLAQNGIEVVRLADDGRSLALAITAWCLAKGLTADNAGIVIGSDNPLALIAGASCGKAGSVLVVVSPEDASAAVEFVQAHASHMAKAWVCSSDASAIGVTFVELVGATA